MPPPLLEFAFHAVCFSVFSLFIFRHSLSLLISPLFDVFRRHITLITPLFITAYCLLLVSVIISFSAGYFVCFHYFFDEPPSLLMIFALLLPLLRRLPLLLALFSLPFRFRLIF